MSRGKRSVRQGARRPVHRLLGEPLEPRSMLSLTVGLGGTVAPSVPEPPAPPSLAPPTGISFEAGVIRIVGDERADKAVISIKTEGHSSNVFVTLDQAKFKQIAIGSQPAVIVKHSEQKFLLSTVSGIYFSGGVGNDSFLNNTSLPSLADGGEGTDVLTGGTGKDKFFGGAGFDWLEGRGGDDALSGGADGDRYLFAPTGTLGVDTIEEDPNRDTDTLDFSAFSFGITVSLRDTSQQTVRPGVLDLVLNSATGIENVTGGAGGDTITGNDRYNSIYGGKGNDGLSDSAAVIVGGGAALYGGDGDDTLTGSNADDAIDGGAGVDSINGNGGGDIIHCGPGTDVDVHGGDGNDTIYGDDGNDTIDGGGGVDTIYGGNGDDTISGGASDDGLQGGPGDDLLRGGPGADLLDGGAGRDGLYGGEGVDTLKGGPGSDRFLQQWHVGSAFEDVIVDADRRDAVPLFRDGDGSTTGVGWSWNGQAWASQEILDADAALDELHRRTGNPALLQYWNGSSWVEDVIVRVSTPMNQIDPNAGPPSPYLLAFNTGTYMVFPNSAVGPASFNYRLQVVQHELGHNFDYASAMSTIFGDGSTTKYTQFLALSSWQAWRPEWAVPKGFVRGGETTPTAFIYSAKAVFASNYGRQAPNEDFATCFESAMANWAGRKWELSGSRTATPVPQKWAFVNNLIAKAATRPFPGA